LGRPAVPTATRRSPNEIVLHINMRDPSNPLEQEAIGILGVNLIYAVFYQLQPKESFLENIAQGVEKRIEIDYLDVRGAAFEGWDQRVILAQLVGKGLAEAVCFPSGGSPAPPIEVLHKKALVLAHRRKQKNPIGAGSFSSDSSRSCSIPEGQNSLMNCSMKGIYALERTGGRSEKLIRLGIADMLIRIDAFHARSDVLLFRERELYSMTAFVNRHTNERARFVVDYLF
jgi:hypothetical protein